MLGCKEEQSCLFKQDSHLGVETVICHPRREIEVAAIIILDECRALWGEPEQCMCYLYGNHQQATVQSTTQ